MRPNESLKGTESGRRKGASLAEYLRIFGATLRRYLNRVPISVGNNPSQRPPRVIAFYLPQFHPIPENDAWWGAGFTEWTHVRKAVPLFRGHQQPKVPLNSDYYDLLNDDTREHQAQLARDAGISGFCYWHYWFGNGKRLLEKPFDQVLASGKPDFHFCLAWANESWTGIWHGMKDKVLISQSYPGTDDYIAHFNVVVHAFQDPRYICVDGNPLFIVYKPWEIPDSKQFTNCWRRLARDHGLKDIYFVGISDTPLSDSMGFDGYMAGAPKIPERTTFPTFAEIFLHRICRLNPRLFFRVWNSKGPQVFPYRSFVRYSFTEPMAACEFPVVVPNWDNTPRVGRRGIVLKGSTPELFALLSRKAWKSNVEKPDEESIIFIKSWNEWAEGNYLEPDELWGSGYLEALKEILNPEKS